jgi:futalosine hydrolase
VDPTETKRIEPGSVLLCVAAPRECRAVLDGLGASDAAVPKTWQRMTINDRYDLIHTGVGKSNAAGAAAAALDPCRHRAVLSVGIAGSLPGSGVELLDVVLADQSLFGDEGIGADDGFIPMDQAGFGAFPDGSMGIGHSPLIVRDLAPIADHVGTVATVSWCSGSDACAQGLVERTGAICEAMEGAAAALATKRVDPSIATGEIRVISNTTGNRKDQRWQLEEALIKLGEVLGRVGDALG